MRPTRTINTRRNAVVLTEACVSIMLAGMVLVLVSLMITRYARATDYFLNHRRAQLAAESCVERMRAGALAVEAAEFTDEAGVYYAIEVGAAPEAFTPLVRVVVTATIIGKHSKQAHYEITTIMAPVDTTKGGGA